MLEILMDLAKLSPIIGLLIVVIIYFYKKEKSNRKEMLGERDKCDLKIKELNKELRNNEKENLQMIGKLADAFDKISTDNKLVRGEIRSLKEYIQIKIDSLKNG